MFVLTSNSCYSLTIFWKSTNVKFKKNDPTMPFWKKAGNLNSRRYFQSLPILNFYIIFLLYLCKKSFWIQNALRIIIYRLHYAGALFNHWRCDIRWHRCANHLCENYKIPELILHKILLFYKNSDVEINIILQKSIFFKFCDNKYFCHYMFYCCYNTRNRCFRERYFSTRDLIGKNEQRFIFFIANFVFK